MTMPYDSLPPVYPLVSEGLAGVWCRWIIGTICSQRPQSFDFPWRSPWQFGIQKKQFAADSLQKKILYRGPASGKGVCGQGDRKYLKKIFWSSKSDKK